VLRVTRQAADPAGEIASLIHDSFAASEGPAEGARVGRLAAALLAGPAPAAEAFLAREGDALVGVVLFSPLAFSDDPRRVLLLSPMAVATGRQGEGIGQRLLGQALARLDAEGVDAVLTYGDPAFYGRLGFRPLDQRETAPPFPLSMPQGWLGRPPGGEASGALPPMRGTSRCAAPLSDPALW